MRPASVAELAILTSMDVRTVSARLGDAGLTPLSKKGRATYYNSAESMKAIYRAGESAKERLDVARAEIAELDLAERRGELLPRDLVLAAQQKRESAARAKFRAMPSNIAGQIAPPGKLQQAENLLREAVDEALGELSGSGDAS